MTPLSLKRWSWIHKWSSLVCTVFMLLLCITGLPMIFQHEIGAWTGKMVSAPTLAQPLPLVHLDRVVTSAQALHPDKTVDFLFREVDEPNVWFAALHDTRVKEHEDATLFLDARTAQVLTQPKLDEGVMYVITRLHVDLFADLPGKLFLGLMGVLLLVAIVSGVVLYAPFMRKLKFGTVRRERTTRIKWLDLHNVLGAVTLVWLLIVGGTGVINTWADLVIKLWQYQELSAMTAPYRNLPPPKQIGSVQAAVDAAQRQEATMSPAFIAFPGNELASPHHYMVFMRGTTAVTSRLYKPVLVDAQTAQVTASRDLPWYASTLLLSQPLHFGDYGGMPLKIIWALLDLLAIVVLGSGLYLWWKKHRASQKEEKNHALESVANL